MEESARYNVLIDEVLERLKLTQDSGVDYVALGPKPALEILFESAVKCTLCPAHKTKNSTAKINLGAGGLRAEVAFVLLNELPKESEEIELLKKMTTAMGLDMGDIYITSAIKCVSEDDGIDNKEAVNACKDLLTRELEYVSPSVVVTLGEEATKALFTSPLPFNSIRGRFQNPASPKMKKNSIGFQVMPTHPLEQLVGNKEKKFESWSDLKKIMTRLKLEPAQ